MNYFFLFDLGGVDVILGMTWLASLGEVQHNWKTLTMSFRYQGSPTQIKGDYSMQKKGFSAKVFGRASDVEAAAMILFYSDLLRDQEGATQGEEQQLDHLQLTQLQHVTERF